MARAGIKGYNILLRVDVKTPADNADENFTSELTLY